MDGGITMVAGMAANNNNSNSGNANNSNMAGASNSAEYKIEVKFNIHLIFI